ncbi:isocitrate lyase/PEP mutase family protein [Actinoplanes sp. TRM 88003]|uniref:Isocitrate lyase/PEP mutase family protein n=1 Tax=Paractinoplanes aksuensis TaxID=2939490 RepID=A0ABT1DIV6_9ACTN|nr:isocitrate lyase/PEP mutase family protein [Actinoplanes aksuensis]MCO8270418.1 isocitrate lyase/PEP mutase family protein [Actinoplanes aksuensis]
MNAFRELLAADRVTHVPGVHDPLSATLAVHAGHRAVYLSKNAVAAVTMGRPDVEFVPATQIADRAATLGPVLGGVPLMADAGAGFESPRDAAWTALAYQRAGITAVVLSDHDGGHVRAMARQAPDVAVVARTTAYGKGGLEATVERCRAYAEGGADAVLPAGIRTPEELFRLKAALPGVPLVLSRSEAGPAAPALADDELAVLGVRLILHPLAALLAAVRAASQAYRAIAEDGTADEVDRMPWAAFTALAASEPRSTSLGS